MLTLRVHANISLALYQLLKCTLYVFPNSKIYNKILSISYVDCFKYGVPFVQKCLGIDTYYNISIQ